MLVNRISVIMAALLASLVTATVLTSTAAFAQTESILTTSKM